MLAGHEEHVRLIETARGELPAELFVLGGTVANVYSGELHEANVAVTAGRIAYVGEGERAIGPDTQILDAKGVIVSPGYIEAHFHPWVLYNPVSLVEGILPLGTTTVVADNLFFFMQMGTERFAAMADDLKDLPLLYLWMARLTSQAKFPGEEEMFALENVEPLLRRDDVIGTAEITRWPALAAGDPALISGIRAAKSLGKIVDGHTGGASEARLQPVAAAGITPHPLVIPPAAPAPEFAAEHGLVDGMLRVAVENGVPPIQALQMVTINPATLFRIDGQVGGIGLGRRADLLLLPDLTSFRPETVITRGRVVAENGALSVPLPRLAWESYGSRPRFDSSIELAEPALYPLRV